MNMMFSAVEFIHRLEGEGLSRGAAEAIAEGIEDRNRSIATKADLAELASKSDLATTRAELDASIARTAARQTAQFGGMLAASVIVLGIIVGIVGLK